MGIESKNGPAAALTANQEVGFEKIQSQGCIPCGTNAAAAGLEPGKPLGPMGIQVDHWP
jgi:hypothetical protein